MCRTPSAILPPITKNGVEYSAKIPASVLAGKNKVKVKITLSDKTGNRLELGFDYPASSSAEQLRLSAIRNYSGSPISGTLSFGVAGAKTGEIRQVFAKKITVPALGSVPLAPFWDEGGGFTPQNADTYTAYAYLLDEKGNQIASTSGPLRAFSTFKAG